MEYYIIGIGIIVFFLVVGIIDRFRKEKALLAEVKKKFGVAVNEEINHDRYESMKAYLNSLPERDTDIDSITWNDLDMDRIFIRLNHTCSAIGEEVLFAWLNKPESGAAEGEIRHPAGYRVWRERMSELGKEDKPEMWI